MPNNAKNFFKQHTLKIIDKHLNVIRKLQTPKVESNIAIFQSAGSATINVARLKKPVTKTTSCNFGCQIYSGQTSYLALQMMIIFSSRSGRELFGGAC